MMIIKSLNLRNFKAFQSLDHLEIKPITIFCGTNSSGKSSIIQSLLLLKQSFERQSQGNLLLNGDLVRLGNFENIIYQKDIEKEIRFELNCKMFSHQLNEFQRKSILNAFFSKDNSEKNKDINLNFNLGLTLQVLKQKQEKKNLINQFEFSLQPNESNDIRNEQKLKIYPNNYGFYQYNENLGGTYVMESNNIKESRLSNKLFVDIMGFNQLCPKEMTVDVYPIPDFPNVINSFLEQVRNLMILLFGKYRYIGPLRNEPQRKYFYEEEIVHLGVSGKNAAYLFAYEKNLDFTESYFYDEINHSFFQNKNEKNAVSLKEAIVKWFQFLGIYNFYVNEEKDIISVTLKSNNSPKTTVSIADVGFGVSQIFPIVLESLRMPIGDSLILEQPEIHLHPKWQAQLADFFIAMALSKKNFLIETHSEHIINRIVLRILEHPELNLDKMINIYFIEPSPTGSICQKIDIDPDKGIDVWPKDFFDQAQRDALAILNSRIKKKHEKKPNN